MRWFSAFFVFACAAATVELLFSAPANASDQFPYTAYVNSEDVYIRSGPGKNYYPTQKLEKGQPVEIYRHDPGGWFAIRPPEGSFSWVPSDALKPIGEHVAVVEKDQAICYVGTKFSSAHDVHQVRLDKGEQVEILDVKQTGDGPDAQTWCQIAPPSGEFRWVFGKLVEREPPSGLAVPPAGSRKSEVGSRSNQSAFSDDGSANQWKTAGAGDGSRKADSGAWRSTNGGRAAADPTASVQAGDPFQNDLNTLDLEVSKMVAEDQAAWEFTALRRKAEAMMPRADTALERGKVRLILNRIARFEDVKRRSDLMNQSTGAIAISTKPTTSLPPDSEPRYDGIGKLTPVVSQRPNAPQFALVDKSNQVVSFITPAPGVNLQPYVGQEVGVSGQRGYMPELKKPHVTAMRVNVIDGGPVLR